MLESMPRDLLLPRQLLICVDLVLSLLFLCSLLLSFPPSPNVSSIKPLTYNVQNLILIIIMNYRLLLKEEDHRGDIDTLLGRIMTSSDSFRNCQPVVAKSLPLMRVVVHRAFDAAASVA